MPKKVTRDAGTGRFVPPGEAKKRPRRRSPRQSPSASLRSRAGRCPLALQRAKGAPLPALDDRGTNRTARGLRPASLASLRGSGPLGL